MGLKSAHPRYVEMLPDWRKVRDVYRGERYVKEKGEEYLPPTQGMRLDGYGMYTAGKPAVGQEAYEAYLLRAVLPEYVEVAVEVFIGLLHSQPPTVELPAEMEPLRDKVTSLGESIEMLLRRVNEEQLVAGRLGLLLDLPKNPDPAKPLPYIALYVAEAGINWDDDEIGDDPAKLNMVVLDESGFRRDGFDWKYVTKLRVLELEPLQADADGAPQFGPYRQGVFTAEGGGDPDYVASDMAAPMIRGVTLDEIPFMFVNTKDIVANPDKPPLLQLAEACLAIFRGEADYRQNLFLQGQDTLVIKGDLKRRLDPNELPAAGDDQTPVRTGTGSMIHLESGAENDAKYIGVTADGLQEQGKSIENDRRRAEAKAGALSTDNASTAESGEALKTRVAARTASLNQIAKTGAAAVEMMLKAAAKWLGADPEQVKVTPNMEFADYQMTGENLSKIMAAKLAGAPLSRESIHELMAEGGLTKYSYEEEKDLLDQEQAELPAPGTAAGGNPPDPNAAPQNQPPAQ